MTILNDERQEGKCNAAAGPEKVWDLESVLQFMRAARETVAWTEEDREWAWLPPIPRGWRSDVEELLLDLLTSERVTEVLGDAVCLQGDHDAKLEGLYTAERERIQKERAQDLGAAMRWGARCKPPWPEVALKRVLRKASKIIRLQTEADERNWSGRAAERLAKDKFEERWGVEGVLLLGQPMMIGGPEKALKTSLAMDLAVSLASGTPFLGRFGVPRKVPVLFYSGESGGAALQGIMRRVASQRDIDLEACKLSVSEMLPPLADADSLDILTALLRNYRGGVVIFDPVYLCLTQGAGNVNPASLFDMGPLLSRAAGACLKSGCTPLFPHHFPKDIQVGRQPQLRDLAFAGFREFARQWLLINRRREYAFDGRHELLMVTGGSAGHAGLWDVNADEGKEDNRPTRWDVTVLPHGHGKDKKGSSDKGQDYGQKVRAAIVSLAAEGRPATKNRMSETTGLNKANVDKGLAALGGEVEEREALIPTHNKGKVKALVYQLSSHRDN